MTKCLEKEEPINLYCDLLDIPFTYIWICGGATTITTTTTGTHVLLDVHVCNRYRSHKQRQTIDLASVKFSRDQLVRVTKHSMLFVCNVMYILNHLVGFLICNVSIINIKL